MLLSVAFVTCFVGGLCPLVNADAFLVAAALLTSGRGAAWLIAVSMVGQVAGKVVFFVAARRSTSMAAQLLGRHTHHLHRYAAAGRTAFLRRADYCTVMSAATSLPPFFVTTFLAATTGVRLMRFATAALLGRFVRSTVLVLVPQLITGG